MQDVDKTKEQLVVEVAHLRQRIAELEAAETERKQAEETLRKSEEKYRTVVEISPDGVAIASKGRHVFANKSLAKIFGVSGPDELLGKPVIDYIHPDYRKIVKERLEQQTNRGELAPLMEEKMLRADGTVIYTEVAAAPLKYEGTQAVLAVIRDITDRKQAEEALRESEERFRQFFENEPEYCYMISPTGVILDVNKAALNVLGYKKEEIVGKPLKIIYAPESLTKMEQLFVKWLKIGHLKDEEMVILTKKGNRRTVLLSANVVKDKDGKVLHSLSVQKDITARKRAEDALKESEENFRALAENAADGIVILTSDGTHAYVNRRAAEIAGYTVDELLQVGFQDLFPQDERKRLFEIFRKKLEGESDIAKYETVIIRKDGTRAPLEVSSALTTWHGKPADIVFSRDITERKRIEDELKLKDDAIASALTAIAIAEFGGNLTYVNPAFLRMWGYDNEEVLGRPAVEFWHEQEQAQKIIAALLKGENVTGELVAKRKDGSLFDVQLSASMVTDESGNPVSMMASFVDITERKQAEEALRESEGRYRALFEGAPDAIFLADPESGEILDANPAASRLLLRSHEEIIALHQSELHPPHMEKYAREKFIEHLEQIRQKKQIRPVENAVISSDGSEIPVEILAQVVQIHGRPVIQGTFRDITERKRAEQELQESEERYRTLVDNIDLGINLIDSNHNIIMVNASMGEKYNKPISEIIRNKCFREFEKRDAVCPHCPGVRTMATGQPAEVETVGVRDDGSRFDVRLQTYPVFGGGGRVIAFIEIAEDITERKQAEKALRESEERYRLLNENIPVAVYSALPDEHSSNLFLSGQFLELTGYPMEQFFKDPELWTSILHPEDKDYVWDKVEEHRRTKDILEVEYRIVTKNNIVKWIRDRAKPVLDENGEILRIDGFMEDVTKRKQAEEALRESEGKYRSLVESSEDSIYLVDKDCAYLFMNKKHLSRLGLKSNKVIGRTYGEFHSSEETRDFSQKVEKVFKTGKSLSYGYRSERDNRYFIRTLSPVKASEDSEPTAVTVNSKDITEVKVAEEALREREAFNFALFHYNPVETIVVDLEGKVSAFNLAKEQTGDRVPSIGDRMYLDYAGKHEIDMRAELIKCIRTGKTKRFPERKYGDKHLSITISPFSHGALIISEDITERLQAKEELQRSQEQLRNLTTYLESVREQERTIIAREIHDELAQALTALKMDVSWLDNRLPRDHMPLIDKIKSMSGLIDTTIKTVKRISAELRPGILDDLGLVAAIEWQAEEFQDRTGIACHVTVEPEDIAVDQDRATAIFRIFQETLTNVARHARATRVTVSLKETRKALTLRVRDNGIGITEEQIADSKSFGLIGIRERVYQWGGNVSITGTPGKGTRMLVSVPAKNGKSQKSLTKDGK